MVSPSVTTVPPTTTSHTSPHRFPALVSLMLSLMLFGCSQEEKTTEPNLLDEVPADAQLVVVADLYDCATEMGLRISSSDIVDASGKKANLKMWPREIIGSIRALAERHSSIDLRHVAFFIDSASQHPVFTAMRIAGTEIADEPDDSRVAVFADDNRIWVAPKPFDSALFDTIAAHAARRSLARCDADREFFADYRPARARLRIHSFRNEAGTDFSTIYITSQADQGSLTLRLTFADTLGQKVDPFDRLAPIDENVYSYLPQATIATIAIGADRNTFRSILSNYGGFIPLRQRMAAELSSGFLCDSAATLAVGFAPGGNAETISDFSLNTWVFTSLLPIDIDRTEDFIDIIDKLSQKTLLCDIAGPYLAVSNASLEQIASGDDYGTMPAESRIRIQAVVPYRSELMKALSLPRGFSLDIDAAHAAVTIRINMLGSDEPPATVLAPALMKFPVKKKFLGK